MVARKKASKASPPKQKSRAKYQCPPELGELIRQVNLIPPDFQMRYFVFELDDQRKLLREQTGDNHAAPSMTAVLNACLKDTPEEFQQYIELETLNRTDPFGMAKPHMVNVYRIDAKADAYSEYFQMRTSMLTLLQRLETERQRMRDVEIRDGLKEGSLTFEHYTLANWDSNPLAITTIVKRNDAGELHPTGLVALLGKFDDSRLRRCEICRRIFWAKRKDSKTCSPRCLNLLNVRNSRSLTAEEKAARKAEREANRELVNNGKAKPTKRKNKNGTV